MVRIAEKHSHHDARALESDYHAGAVRDPASAGNASAAPDRSNELPRDLSAREMTCLIPIALCVLILGWFPNLILNTIERPVQNITQAVPSAPGAPALAAAK